MNNVVARESILDFVTHEKVKSIHAESGVCELVFIDGREIKMASGCDMCNLRKIRYILEE